MHCGHVCVFKYRSALDDELSRSGSSLNSVWFQYWPLDRTFVVIRTFSRPARKRSSTAKRCSTVKSPGIINIYLLDDSVPIDLICRTNLRECPRNAHQHGVLLTTSQQFYVSMKYSKEKFKIFVAKIINYQSSLTIKRHTWQKIMAWPIVMTP